MTYFFDKKSGFTLIEIMVVISIISVLISSTITVYSEARAKARDAERLNDLHVLSSSLEVYLNRNGRYPDETWCDSSIGSSPVSCPSMIGGGTDTGAWDTSSTFYTQFVGGGYVAELPEDPINDTTYYYNYEPSNNNEPPGKAAGQGYFIRARLEKGGYVAVCGGTFKDYFAICKF